MRRRMVSPARRSLTTEVHRTGAGGPAGPGLPLPRRKVPEAWGSLRWNRGRLLCAGGSFDGPEEGSLGTQEGSCQGFQASFGPEEIPRLRRKLPLGEGTFPRAGGGFLRAGEAASSLRPV